ncbi:universal stress protein [Leptothermofonsia sichuanensis E412]|uniref:universal stress protein n=1 Tax=Leptothermofonsia sichuanensis TaxID=2917832 RepID=UPI001CA62356|nr:universal stress protein [Leptothermofonsia sichuanensis]QZZ19917.1 universal stress protein [Leptothermofonsia sichuanensis E412]
MFQKILVALDHSTMSRLVFQHALDLANTSSASLMLVHILSSAEEGHPVPTVPDRYAGELGNMTTLYLHQWEIYQKEGLDFLRSHAAEAINRGINTEYIQSQGNPAQEICQLARTWEADLIILSRHGRSGLSELLLGSVSNHVVHHAPCSVLTIHPLAA